MVASQDYLSILSYDQITSIETNIEYEKPLSAPINEGQKIGTMNIKISGKPKITINKMLTFDSVKNRLEREQPLSFLEFNYMLLQAYDFFHLNKEHECELQLGGSDQWGNIIAGIDLIRRLNNKKAFAITSPLITNNDGSKMGKTADGAIWLDEKKLSNYDFYQFWRNVNDSDVPKFINLFTKLPIEERRRLTLLKDQEINEAKKILAFEVTKITRGEKQAKEAEEISTNIFLNNKNDNRINSLEIESNRMKDSSFSILDAVEKLNLVKSRSEIKRLIKSNGIKVLIWFRATLLRTVGKGI